MPLTRPPMPVAAQGGAPQMAAPRPAGPPGSQQVQLRVSNDEPHRVFCLSWLKATYEPCPGKSIEQNIMYKQYLASMHRMGRKEVISAQHYALCIRTLFGGSTGPNKKAVGDKIENHYTGIQVRAQPLPLKLTPAQAAAAQEASRQQSQAAPTSEADPGTSSSCTRGQQAAEPGSPTCSEWSSSAASCSPGTDCSGQQSGTDSPAGWSGRSGGATEDCGSTRPAAGTCQCSGTACECSGSSYSRWSSSATSSWSTGQASCSS